MRAEVFNDAGIGAKPNRRFRQRPLFCRCGCGAPFVHDICRSCYARVYRSRSRFGNNREAVLERDGYMCRICGASNQQTVHHRCPGEHRQDLLLTVCPACHARIHRLAAIDRYVPPALLPFWMEQHPGVPTQLQLAF